MITIKDIYQWFKNENINSPKPPSNLTPIQKIEWDEQNSDEVAEYRDLYKNKSFKGEQFKDMAQIMGIYKDRISARVIYKNEFSNDMLKEVLTVQYRLIYDESFYETIKLIHNYTYIEFEGEILDFEITTERRAYDANPTASYYKDFETYHIKLKLTKINTLKEQLSFPASLLDDEYIPPKSPPLVKKSNQCFIATAAFGNQDKIEVIQLRKYRDSVLSNSFAGRCFISVYYILSPPIAIVIRQSNWLRKYTRLFLRKVVLPITKQ